MKQSKIKWKLNNNNTFNTFIDTIDYQNKSKERLNLHKNYVFLHFVTTIKN